MNIGLISSSVPLDAIVDKSPAQKAMRVDVLRAELKALGYSVVVDSYLALLLIQARHRQPQKRPKPRLECIEQAAG